MSNKIHPPLLKAVASWILHAPVYGPEFRAILHRDGCDSAQSYWWGSGRAQNEHEADEQIAAFASIRATLITAVHTFEAILHAADPHARRRTIGGLWHPDGPIESPIDHGADILVDLVASIAETAPPDRVDPPEAPASPPIGAGLMRRLSRRRVRR